MAAELVLAMAIPFIAIGGYHALLDSQAGQFVGEPTEDEPGWRALVEPSPVAAVVEVDQGEITGIAVLAGHTEETLGGAVMLVPATLEVDGQTLAARDPASAVAALAAELRLGIPTFETVDEARWQSVLGGRTYAVSNPDPVAADDGSPILTVGPTDIEATNASTFLGRPADGADPVTLLYRRRLFWSAVLSEPPATDDPLAETIASVSGPDAQVVDLPLRREGAGLEVDDGEAEHLIRTVVPIPTGSVPGDRVRVRVVDRTGSADLRTVAATVAGTGAEVVEIGNAPSFDGGTTHLVVPAGLDDQAISELAMLTGATTVHDSEAEPDGTVTLLVGSDFAASR